MLLLTKYTVLYKENEICCIILLSLPSRERGLKLLRKRVYLYRKIVAPFAGAWIEILYSGTPGAGKSLSLPSRERGLKLALIAIYIISRFVAPFAGAWIEIYYPTFFRGSDGVAPFAGAWIEI